MECPKCNYPNMDGIVICNDCGYDLKKQNLLNSPLMLKQNKAEGNHEFNKTQKVNLDQDSEGVNLKETISDKEYHLPISKGKFILQPVSLGSELDYNPLFFDNEIVINRSIIDKGDFSISSGEHAKIYKSNGEWFIENNASNAAVFLSVKTKHKIQIEEGDIILIGSKKFFEFQKNNEEEE